MHYIKFYKNISVNKKVIASSDSLCIQTYSTSLTMDESDYAGPSAPAILRRVIDKARPTGASIKIELQNK